ncbi:MAG: hypothetical protein H6631_04080 [Anaerolineaceae bacterium]|nr:hypothetical protein [Anaerolineaceae bacterium]
MTVSEHKRQGFIIRIWYEPREIEGAPPQWRGSIESTQEGDRQYIKSLDEIVNFILPYLEKMGVEVEMDWWFQQWLNRRRRSISPHNVPDGEKP